MFGKFATTAGLATVLVSSSALAIQQLPVQAKSGPYNMSGKIVTVVASGGAGCDVRGATVSGPAAYKPAFHEATGIHPGVLFVTIGPDTGQPNGIAYQLRITVSNGATASAQGGYAIALTANSGTTAFVINKVVLAPSGKSFTLNLETTTGPQSSGTAGTCKTSYALSFTFGFSNNVVNALKSLL